jgi:hypothetical protein
MSEIWTQISAKVPWPKIRLNGRRRKCYNCPTSYVQPESCWIGVGSYLKSTASSWGLAPTFESVSTMGFHLDATCALCNSSRLCQGSLTILMCWLLQMIEGMIQFVIRQQCRTRQFAWLCSYYQVHGRACCVAILFNSQYSKRAEGHVSTWSIRHKPD